ncbi:putative short-chain dehydrogenase/reductase family protein [Daldinia eschscholtzii]|nr:putative short-chain dehydrogenase/reductase family protein [Daldinia eschscholtzii]
MPGDISFGFVMRWLWGQLFCTVPMPNASFKGQTVIITGSNQGLGYEAARHIIKLGASKLIMAVRSIEKGEAAKLSLEKSTGCDSEVIEVWPIDLCSYESVKAFAERATRELERVDVLLENAGVNRFYWDWAEDNEMNLTVNVVSTFLLAFLMLPKLKETATRFNTQPRLTIVTSDTHYFVDFPEKDAPEGIFKYMNDREKFDTRSRYPTSKLMEVFVVREMAARRPIDSYPVIINLVNPGLCKSELVRDANLVARTINGIIGKTAEEGSRNLVNGACAGPETHGQYLDFCRITRPATVVVGPQGPQTQKRVWDEVMAKLDAIVPDVSKNL